MSGSIQRVNDAFAFRTTDRTPLFEIYSPFHPIQCVVARRSHREPGCDWTTHRRGIRNGAARALQAVMSNG